MITSTPNRFYLWAALAAAAIAFAGFARTYYLKAWFGTPEISSLVHAHGVVMTLWVVLFIVQVRLVAMGRRDLHRKLGVAGAVLAVAIVVLGLFTAVSAARRGIPVGPPPLVFMAITMSVVVVFAIFVIAALLYRKRVAPRFRLGDGVFRAVAAGALHGRAVGGVAGVRAMARRSRAVGRGPCFVTDPSS